METLNATLPFSSSTLWGEIQSVSFDFFYDSTSNVGVRGLRGALILTLAFMVVEAVVGTLFGSLTLVADATHMLADSGALATAALVGWLATRRAEAWGALFSGFLIAAIVAYLVSKAVGRLMSPEEIREPAMVFATAALGLGVNVLVLKVLDHDHDHAHGVHHKAARLHVLTDLGGSLVAMLSAALVGLVGWVWVDPVASLALCVIVGVAGVRLLREAYTLLQAEGARRR